MVCGVLIIGNGVYLAEGGRLGLRPRIVVRVLVVVEAVTVASDDNDTEDF